MVALNFPPTVECVRRMLIWRLGLNMKHCKVSIKRVFIYLFIYFEISRVWDILDSYLASDLTLSGYDTCWPSLVFGFLHPLCVYYALVCVCVCVFFTGVYVHVYEKCSSTIVRYINTHS